MNGKETDITYPENTNPIVMETSEQSQVHICDSGYESSVDDPNVQDFKFYFIKTTKKSKTGFPVLHSYLNPSLNGGKINSDVPKSKNCIHLRTLEENAEAILVPGIRAFLKKCYVKSADKRRRSSRVCKHKPGVKHYCGRKNWDTILSKYKSEILEHPLLNLDCFHKGKSVNTNKYITQCKQNLKENNIEPEDCSVLTSQKEISQQESESNYKRIHHSKLSDSDTTSPDGSWTSDSNSECPAITCNEMNEMSTFLAIFGLRKVSQKETVNYDNLKVVTDETCNNDDTGALESLNKTSGGIDTKYSDVDVTEGTTNIKISTNINVVSDDIKENCETNLNIHEEDMESQVLISEKVEQGEIEKDIKGIPSEENLEDLHSESTPRKSFDTDNANSLSDVSLVTANAAHECTCHSSENMSCHINTVNEACVSLHSSANVNNFLVENLLRNGSWNISACPPTQSSSRNCETKELFSNNQEHDVISPGNRMIPNFHGPFSVSPIPQMSCPRQMYSSGGINGVFPNFYGSPCIPTPILTSQIVSPILTYNFLPMNNIMCTSHPGIVQFPSNGAFVSAAYDCSSQHSAHHSVPLPYHAGQNSHSTLYHKPGLHQLVNVNASTGIPCWTQSTYIGGSHLPCCGGHAVEARSHLHYSSGLYPADSYNGLLSYPLNSDYHIGNDALSVHGRKLDDVK